MSACKHTAQALGLKAQPTDSASRPSLASLRVIDCVENEAPCGSRHGGDADGELGWRQVDRRHGGSHASTAKPTQTRRAAARHPLGGEAQSCRLMGRYWLVDGAASFFEFTLSGGDAVRAAERTYRGRGWLQDDAEGEAIVLVGGDGHSGFGLFAR